MGHHPKKKPEDGQLTTKEKLKQIKKEKKLKLKEKRAKLIVRNLRFQVTEDNLKEHFEKFGEIDNIKILKKEDGKLVGCAFIQFKLVQKAAKARHHTNGKDFMGRELDVDFALAKNKYVETKNTEEKVKEEVVIKEEPIDPDEIKKEPSSDEEEMNETKNVENKDENSNEEKDIIIEPEKIKKKEEGGIFESSDEESEEETNDSDNDVEEIVDKIEEKRRPRIESHDVSENKTIFVKNVPFTATNEDLKECMLQFGPIYYALICMDKLTEHSKGTGFVKFREKEDAEKALNAGTELTLLGNVLDCHKALDRSEIKQKSLQKIQEKSVPKDSRNLYLVKEGVILASTKAAEGVSASDMAKRLQIEQYKTQMLRNLNMFISRDRLVIHNLPANWDDKKLRTLLQKYSPQGANIKEARVMRDLRNVDANGLGQSKEFGFVRFTNHEDALYALRSLNNNPKIFNPNKRPIITFSIENKSMIRTKQKRLEKSKIANPKSKEYNPKKLKEDGEEKVIATKARRKPQQQNDEEEQKEFSGVTAKPGPQKLRSKFKLKTQAKMHFANLKKEKQKQKFVKKTLAEKQKEFTKQPKQKINPKRKREDDDNFSKIVAKYKQKLVEPMAKKSKWFE